MHTPVSLKRSSSKNRTSTKKKSMLRLSSTDDTPGKEDAQDINESGTTIEKVETAGKQCSLEGLGFLKEKLLICCNIIRKRLKSVEHKLDKKKGIRTDR